ncbi:hypothetical protein M569_08961, partial [Genlisea aurea]
METKNQNCLVLIVPFPDAGHRIPLIHFAKHLASRGLQILLVLPPPVAETVNLPPPPDSSNFSTAVISDGEPHEGFAYHPSVSCFVTHSGWNSTIEAISHGVPMIGFGVTMDQITNAKLIQDMWEVGVRLSGG